MEKGFFLSENSRPVGFTTIFYQTFRTKVIPILHKLFRRTEEDGLFPNSFCEVSIIQILKLEEDNNRKLKTNIFNEQNYKNSKQNFSKANPTLCKKNDASWPNGIYPKNAGLVQHLKANNEIHYINNCKRKIIWWIDWKEIYSIWLRASTKKYK